MDGMEAGTDAAILGADDYVAQLSQEQIETIWETGMRMNGTSYEAIGNHFFKMGT